jgi:hypothetical protein
MKRLGKSHGVASGECHAGADSWMSAQDHRGDSTTSALGLINVHLLIVCVRGRWNSECGICAGKSDT